MCYTQYMATRKTLNVSLTPHWARFVEKQVKSGKYQSASEVVRRGLSLIAEEAASFEAWRTEARRKIEEGYQHALRGELVPADDVMARLREKSKKYRARRKAS